MPESIQLGIRRASQRCAQLDRRCSFENMLSYNPRMHDIFKLIEHLSKTQTTVLIEGETGTGKELVAQALHRTSSVRDGPMVAVNCAALPEQLLESELFGHEKGAFTGALCQRTGRFELADGGTIFLDEVGDIPPSLQAKLLRVLQERRFERVGGTRPIEVKVRIIAATNRSLMRMVKEGTFREDLYYRLNVVKIEIPPLRERIEDVPLLASHFLEKYARGNAPAKDLSTCALHTLQKHHWPGNVRELENAMEHACVTSANGVILVENLPAHVQEPVAPIPAFVIDTSQSLGALLRMVVARIEKQYICRALQQSRGNVEYCAKICGLSRRAISGKISAYGIDRTRFEERPELPPRRLEWGSLDKQTASGSERRGYGGNEEHNDDQAHGEE